MPNTDIGYLIKTINDKLKAKADADLKHFNLTFSQSRVLAFLNGKGGETTQKEIEVFLSVSHPTVVGIVSRMEQNGYLISFTDKKDKRNKIVRLTEKAMKIGNEMEQNMIKNEQMLLSPLSSEQTEQLKEMLMSIYENLE